MTAPTSRRRVAPLVRWRLDPRSKAERFLAALGVDPAFAESLLGDLAEERELRAARDGAVAARRWYVAEAVRSLPHVAWSWVRYSRKHAPERLAAVVGALAVAPLVVAFVLSLRDGPPARFVGAREGGVVVNSLHPVHVPMRVLDARGHVLKGAGLRYEWLSGVPVRVSPNGVVTCTTRGDARIRVSAGSVATEVALLCRPVRLVVASAEEMSFVVGEPARDVGFSAVDSAGRVVSPLTGTLTIKDTSVAVLLHGPDGYRVEPRAPGRTFVDAHVGDHGASVMVQVYPRTATLEGVVEDQQRAAVAVALSPGEMRQWRLAPGRYVITMLPRGDAGRTPGLAILGANCVGGNRVPRFVCVAGANTWVIAYHQPRGGAADTVRGFVALQRAE